MTNETLKALEQIAAIKGFPAMNITGEPVEDIQPCIPDHSQQFINDCLRTKSDKFYGDKVNLQLFGQILSRTITFLQMLDGMKKAIFYAKECKEFDIAPKLADDDCSDINKEWKVKGWHEDFMPVSQTTDIIHCILGKATESGESLELLYGVLFEGKEFDKTNFIEELGDGQWYDAIGANAVGVTLEEIQSKVIAKLKTRFPDKYSDEAANNRDLNAERKTLES